MRCITLVIADRHPVVLQGLTSVFESESCFKIVARCGDGTNCIEAIRSLAPDVAILGISMPGLSGLEILAIANAEKLTTRLVFFSESVEDRDLVTAAGAYGVLPKDMALERLVQSLLQVADGRKLLPPLRSDQLISRDKGNIAIAENALTDRERQIIALVCEGLSNKEIARRLNIADGTIKVHLHNVFQKLEISNRTLLAALAIAHGENRSA
jgi:two-component system nitrate/nitrite response regulator NarL